MARTAHAQWRRRFSEWSLASSCTAGYTTPALPAAQTRNARGPRTREMSQHELQLDAARPLRDALDAAFRDIVGFAREMVALASEEPERAVHDYRRSLRRARAMVALTAPALSPRAYGWVASSLKAAFQDTGELRDHGVLLPVLAELAPALSDPELVPQLESRLAAERGVAVAAPKVARLLRERERDLAGLEDIYGAGLDEAVDAEAMLESIRASFAYTRDAYRKVKATRRTPHLHAWRKAVKSLRYQLELLASAGDPGYAAAHAGALLQASRLGEVTDAMALRDVVKALRKELEGVDVKRAVAELGRVIQARIEVVLGESEPYYAVKRKRYALAPEPEPEPAPEALEPDPEEAEKAARKAAKAAEKRVEKKKAKKVEEAEAKKAAKAEAKRAAKAAKAEAKEAAKAAKAEAKEAAKAAKAETKQAAKAAKAEAKQAAEAEAKQPEATEPAQDAAPAPATEAEVAPVVAPAPAEAEVVAAPAEAPAPAEVAA
ncbi:MAG: CHAD domain-containing protein, partial [Deltaproteobacteria bacterium]